MKIRKINAATAMGSLTASVALLAGMNGAYAQGAPGAGSFPGSFLVPGTQTSLKIGGYVKWDYTYDFGQMMVINGGASPFGIIMDSHVGIPATPASPGGDPKAVQNAGSGHNIHGNSQMTASESRFNIETRTPTSYGELKTFIEGDFTNPNGLSNSNSLRVNSNSYGFRLRQAYGTLGPFLAGQTLSLFRDGAAEAETLDFGGAMANGVTRQPQARYTFDFGNGLTWAVAAENPQTQVVNAANGTDKSTFGMGQGEKIPDFTSAVTFNAPWGHVAGRLVLRDVYWHNGASNGSNPFADNPSSSKLGWGLGVSGHWNTGIGKDVLAGEASYGEGVGRYINSDGPPTPDAVYATDATATGGADSRAHKLKTIPAWLVMANYVHFWTDTLRTNIAGSYWHQDNKADDYNTSSQTFATQNKRAYTGHVNLIWSPVPQTNFGVEFMRMYFQQQSGQSGALTRVQVSAQFKF